MVVRAFDGTRREVRGEIDLPVQIGPHTCQVTFQIMDINPPYSCLLGRPWIHSVGVVPSTLHQKLKFVVEGHLVIVSGEEDILVSCPSSMPYVEAAEESLETVFQSFEVVSISSVDSLFGQPRLYDAGAKYIKTLVLNNGCSREIQMVITFHSEVRFSCYDGPSYVGERLRTRNGFRQRQRRHN